MNFDEACANVRANMAALESVKPTAQQVADAFVAMAPAMQEAWDRCMGDDALWAMRARNHGTLRTWWLRWQLRKGRRKARGNERTDV